MNRCMCNGHIATSTREANNCTQRNLFGTCQPLDFANPKWSLHDMTDCITKLKPVRGNYSFPT